MPNERRADPVKANRYGTADVARVSLLFEVEKVMKILACIMFLFIGIGRLTIDGRPLSGGWAAWYEALAHMALSALIVFGVLSAIAYKKQGGSWKAALSNPYLTAAVLLTLFEVYMVLTGPFSPLDPPSPCHNVVCKCSPCECKCCSHK